MRKPDLLKPRFNFWVSYPANIHPSNPKDDSDELSRACLLGKSKPSQPTPPSLHLSKRKRPENLPAPLFTGRLSLPVLKCGTPICLNRDLTSGSLIRLTSILQARMMRVMNCHVLDSWAIANQVNEGWGRGGSPPATQQPQFKPVPYPA
jgi:hypothetical protein